MTTTKDVLVCFPFGDCRPLAIDHNPSARIRDAALAYVRAELKVFRAGRLRIRTEAKYGPRSAKLERAHGVLLGRLDARVFAAGRLNLLLRGEYRRAIVVVGGEWVVHLTPGRVDGENTVVPELRFGRLDGRALCLFCNGLGWRYDQEADDTPPCRACGGSGRARWGWAPGILGDIAEAVGEPVHAHVC